MGSLRNYVILSSLPSGRSRILHFIAIKSKTFRSQLLVLYESLCSGDSAADHLRASEHKSQTKWTKCTRNVRRATENTLTHELTLQLIPYLQSRISRSSKCKLHTATLTLNYPLNLIRTQMPADHSTATNHNRCRIPRTRHPSQSAADALRRRASADAIIDV